MIVLKVNIKTIQELHHVAAVNQVTLQIQQVCHYAMIVQLENSKILKEGQIVKHVALEKLLMAVLVFVNFVWPAIT